MGHVPPRPVPATGAGPHLPGRQRRAAGEAGAVALTDRREELGISGERLAAWYLRDHGLVVLAANVEVEGGEIDLLARDGSTRVAVEVRTRIGGPDPIDAADRPKRAHVASLARRIGAHRVDLVGIRLDRAGLDVHWVPDAC